jgi:hypothetical protein
LELSGKMERENQPFKFIDCSTWWRVSGETIKLDIYISSGINPKPDNAWLMLSSTENLFR